MIKHTSMMCPKILKNGRCPEGDDCPYSHNRVEEFYHPEKYKTKFCQGYPNALYNCEYGANFCAFAHTDEELTIDQLHRMEFDSDFYMFYFKTEWCPFVNSNHNKAKCDYAHNWQDFRRKPHLFDYSPLDLCQNWQAGTFIGSYHEGCPLQAFCSRSHGWKE